MDHIMKLKACSKDARKISNQEKPWLWEAVDPASHPVKPGKVGKSRWVHDCARGSHRGFCKPHAACVCCRFEVPTFKYEDEQDKEAYS